MAEKTEFKISIKATDMEESLQKKTEELALKAFETCRQEKQLANYLKSEFDKQDGLGWNCVVGRNFGSHVVHQTKNIFADHNQNQANHVPLPHLQLNVKAREKALQNLQNKVHFEQNILENKNASYVSLLLKEYKAKVSAIRLEKMQEELKIKSTDFESIFAQDQAKEEMIERKINDRMKEDYYEKYVLKPQEQENTRKMLRAYTKTRPIDQAIKKGQYKVRISAPEFFKPSQEEDRLREEEVLRMNQLQKQYDLYQAMVGDLFEKNEELIQKTSDKFICKNTKILEALEPVVLGSMSVFADDISEMLIDDLLEESVVHLNRVEEYKENVQLLMNQTEKNHEELVPELKKKPLPYNVLKALKALDEYADDD